MQIQRRNWKGERGGKRVSAGNIPSGENRVARFDAIAPPTDIEADIEVTKKSSTKSTHTAASNTHLEHNTTPPTKPIEDATPYFTSSPKSHQPSTKPNNKSLVTIQNCNQPEPRPKPLMETNSPKTATAQKPKQLNQESIFETKAYHTRTVPTSISFGTHFAVIIDEQMTNPSPQTEETLSPPASDITTHTASNKENLPPSQWERRSVKQGVKLQTALKKRSPKVKKKEGRKHISKNTLNAIKGAIEGAFMDVPREDEEDNCYGDALDDEEHLESNMDY